MLVFFQVTRPPLGRHRHDARLELGANSYKYLKGAEGAGAEAPKAPELRDETSTAEEYKYSRSSRQRAEDSNRQHKNTDVQKLTDTVSLFCIYLCILMRSDGSAPALFGLLLPDNPPAKISGGRGLGPLRAAAASTAAAAGPLLGGWLGLAPHLTRLQ